MKEKPVKLYTRFAREKRFVVKPTPAAQRRQKQAAQLAELKNRSLEKALSAAADPALYIPYQRAAGDAAAVAWLTGWPLLFFPTLFEEKIQEARQYVARQKLVRQGRMHQREAA